MKKITLFLLLTVNFVFAQTPQWRPTIHFSPQKNWTNDPNGLVYHEGEWHLFFQYNPEGDKWGNMSWGHAVSTDLVNWQELPVAIPQDSVWIFSGCVVIDKNNTAGFGANVMVAVYTADYHGKKENQHLAYSTDKGRTWTKYAKNPIIAIPHGSKTPEKDFRDPNIIWHEPTKKWIMSVVLPKQFKTQFYASKDLKNWTFLSDFGNQGDLQKMWECPALIEVPIENSNATAWVLMLSSNGPYQDYVGMQYFVGEFDGKTFKNLNSPDTKLYVDFGRDYYAAIPFSNAPDNRKITLGWMASWQYAEKLPTNPWRGQMTLPREIALRKTANGLRLVQKPTKEVSGAATWKNVMFLENLNVEGEDGMGITMRSHSDTYKIEIEFEPLDSKEFGLKLLKKTTNNNETIIGYSVDNEQVYFNRVNSGGRVSDDFPAFFGGIQKLDRGRLKMLIIVDKSSIETFVNDGEFTMTNLVFAEEGSRDWQIFSRGGKVKVVSVNISEW